MSHTASQWLYFPEQWDPKSPWHDQRVRQAANFGLDRDNINQAIQLGHALLYDNAFVPAHFEFFDKAPPPPPFDAAKGRQLLAEAGHPGGVDAGPLYCDAAFANIGQAMARLCRPRCSSWSAKSG